MNLGSKNALSELWSSVILLRIYQLLLTFIVDKPTTTTKLEEQIEISDLPEVVVCILCMTPGFNSSSLNHHGYQSGTYCRGVLQPTKLIGDFVGWNGGTQENKSSDRILEEALPLPKSEEIFDFALQDTLKIT